MKSGKIFIIFLMMFLLIVGAVFFIKYQVEKLVFKKINQTNIAGYTFQVGNSKVMPFMQIQLFHTLVLHHTDTIIILDTITIWPEWKALMKGKLIVKDALFQNMEWKMVEQTRLDQPDESKSLPNASGKSSMQKTKALKCQSKIAMGDGDSNSSSQNPTVPSVYVLAKARHLQPDYFPKNFTIEKGILHVKSGSRLLTVEMEKAEFRLGD